MESTGYQPAPSGEPPILRSEWNPEDSCVHSGLSLTVLLIVWLVNLTSLGFNFDGETDIVWHHHRTGEAGVWFMNRTNFVTVGGIAHDVETGWQIVAAADFNRDGHTDLFWRNSATSESGLWLMKGTNRIERHTIEAGSMEYYAAGTGDFNGDGYPDVLWCHKTEDLAGVWFMNGTNRTGQIGWLIHRRDLNWRAAATGDFNNDGSADIVWRHQANGKNVIWFMNGTNLVHSTEIRQESDLGNHLVGTGQFNSLGNTDLLWRHTNGQNSVWLMNGAEYLHSARLSAQADTNWVIAGTGGYSNSMLLCATSTAAPAAITLAWRYGPSRLPAIERKLPASSSWTILATNYLPLRFTDTNVKAGERYEYRVGGNYVMAGIDVAPVEDRGKVILIVERSAAKALAAELARLTTNLVGDGWTVIRTNVPRHDDARWTANTNGIADIKSFIAKAYAADPADTKTVFLIGHVPIPYSGFHNPDGHGSRALPADSYYGDVDGVYTDSRINNASSIDPREPRHENRIGDGKWDQNRYSSALELAVGRIDFANMRVFKNKSEMDLLRQYLDKDHHYRQKQATADERVVVGSFFPQPKANRYLFQQALKVGNRFFGLEPAHVVEGDLFGASNSALWGFIGGWGLPYRIQGNGRFHTSEDMANPARLSRVYFACLYGSYLVDWEYPNNLMRAFLGSGNYGLGVMWLLCHDPGHVELSLEQLGLGETLGSGFLRTMNNSMDPGASFTFCTLLSDPTLRMQILDPPKNLSTAGRPDVKLAWKGSTETGQYFVYRSTNGLDGPWKRLTLAPIAATGFTDQSAPPGAKLYQVRAVKLIITGSGSYTNLSQGAFRSAN